MMIETVGELTEALKELDPNLRLLINTDGATRSGYNLSVEEIHQISADFVKISLDFVGFTADPK